MTMNENVVIQLRDLDDLMIKYYRAFKSVALIDARGTVLAQLEAQPNELGPHLQFRLMRAALEHRWGTEQWEIAGYGIRHNNMITVSIDGELKDYHAPEAPDEDLFIVEDQLRTKTGPLAPKTLNMNDLYEAITE